jgi:hypothetical protein
VNLAVFANPLGYLTAVMNRHLRTLGLPHQLREFNVEIVEQDPTVLPDEGIYIQGLWFEAAKWDTERKELVELDDGMLVSPAPIMHLVPVERAPLPISGVYHCPVFIPLLSDREIHARGPLVKTVMTLPIPTAKSADFWVIRGASLLLSVDD